MSEHDLKFNFKQSPTIYKFLQDNSFVRGVVGPVGSGKSYACAAEIFKSSQAKGIPKRWG